MADASPLIALAAAGLFDLPRRLFGRVTITRAVLEEIKAGGRLPGAAELDAAMREGWIRVAPTPMQTWAFPALGAGEASTLALASEHSGESLVLMDDALGRSAAAEREVRVMTIADLVLEGKRAGVIERIEPVFARLAKRGFIVPADAVRGALEDAGEG